MGPILVGCLAACAALASSPQQEPPFVAPGRNKVAWAGSPHCDARPDGAVIDTIVLHHTASPSLEGVVSWFKNPASRVSSHYTIGKDGSIVQHVSTFKRAWHAGTSQDKFGRSNVNGFSVGIEMVNVGDGKDPWTDAQVEAVYLLMKHLIRHRFTEIKQITSHEYIAVPHGRKIDPLGFPWERLQDLGVELVYKVDWKKEAPPGETPDKP